MIDFESPPKTTNGASKVAPQAIALLDGSELAKPLPPLEYLVREIGLVAGGGAPHLDAGYGFAGKTIKCQSAVLSLVATTPVWGAYRARRAFRAIHVDMEQGRPLTQRRYQRLALPMGVDLAGLGDRLVVAVMPPISLTVAHRSAWRDLMLGRDFMVIDSLRAATGGEDENDSGIRAGLDMLGTLSEETKCRALVIHHARKPTADDAGGRYSIRGSSAIYDACDSVYVCSASKGEPVLVEHVKARSHGEPTENVALVIEDVEIDGDPKAGVRVVVHGAELVTQKREEKQAETRRSVAARDAVRVRDALVRQPGLGTRELRSVTCLSGDRVAAALLALGAAVETREEPQQGRRPKTRHYLRGAS